MRGALLAALVVAAGCGSKPPCRLIPSGVPGQDPGGIEGVPETVEVPLGIGTTTGDCSAQQAKSVTVSLLDPRNAPVQNTATLVNGADLTQTSARVAFTPAIAGSYHLSARFEPGLKTVQMDLVVAADRSDAGVHQAPVLPGCTQFGLSNGQPLCLGAGKLSTIGASAAIDQLDAGRFNVDETGRVWITDESGGQWLLRSYDLDGGAFVQSGSCHIGFQGTTRGLVARGGRATVLDEQGIHFFVRDGDGGINPLAFQGFPSFPTPNFDGGWCLQMAAPEEVVLAPPVASNLSGQLSVCFFDATGIVCPSVGFVPPPAQITIGGTDDDGAWWSDGSRVRVWNASSRGDAGEIVSVSSTLTFTLPDCNATEVSPIVLPQQLIPRVTSDGILFEKYPLPAGATVSANSRYVAIEDNGTWRWWDR